METGPGTPAPSDSELEANQGQAAYFRAELEAQMKALDAEAVILRVKLAERVAAGKVDKIGRLQRRLREIALQQREVADMLGSLSRRFPPTGVDPR